jgi:site-specific recombinase XerC
MAATSGVSIQITKEVLGDTDIRTTQKYAHLDVIDHSKIFEAQKQEKGKKPVMKNTELSY